MNAQRNSITIDRAQQIAIEALTFLAGDPELLMRFLTATGLTPQTLREKAHTPALMAAILDHLLADESLLLVFCASSQTPPEDIFPAKLALTGKTH